MAIRGFRKKMKPIVWIITIFFLISLVAGYVFTFKSSSQNVQYAFKLNGDKVSLYNAQRALALGEANYKRGITNTEINSELINTVAFNEYLDKLLLLDIAKQIGVNSTEEQAKEQIKAMEARFNGKEQFKQALLAQGYTERTLRKEIEEALTINELSTKIANEEKVSEAEVEDFYNQNKFTYFKKNTLSEVKDQIIKILQAEKAKKTLAIKLEQAKETMKLTSVNKTLTPFLSKVDFSYEGIDITNVDYDKKILEVSRFSQTANLEEIKSIAKEEIEKNIKYLKLLQQNGIVVDSKLPLDTQLMIATQEAFNKFKNETKITDKQLIEFFDKNRKIYDVEKSVDANIALFVVAPTEEDKKQVESKANNILKKVNTKNFATYARKYSSCPSANNGGSLGTFKKGTMVKEFDAVAFSGEVGKIYPKIVKTQFGEHIIYIQSRDEKKGTVTASHILITPTPSEKTLNTELKTVSSLVKDLQAGKVTFGELKQINPHIQFSQNIPEIKEQGTIQSIGYNENLIKQLFASKLNKVGYIKDDNGFVIYQKVKETPYQKASLTKIKPQVEAMYKAEKALEKLKELQDTANQNL